MEEFFVNEIKRIKGDLFRVANSILQNHADAQDAVSESIIKAYSKRYALKSRDSFKFWMMKILVRECYALRKSMKRIAYTQALPDTMPAPEAPTRELWDVVAGLGEEFRIIVVLFYYEDLSIHEISRLLHISEGTVKSRLYRAREKLKGLLGECGSREV